MTPPADPDERGSAAAGLGAIVWMCATFGSIVVAGLASAATIDAPPDSPAWWWSGVALAAPVVTFSVGLLWIARVMRRRPSPAADPGLLPFGVDPDTGDVVHIRLAPAPRPDPDRGPDTTEGPVYT